MTPARLLALILCCLPSGMRYLGPSGGNVGATWRIRWYFDRIHYKCFNFCVCYTAEQRNNVHINRESLCHGGSFVVIFFHFFLNSCTKLPEIFSALITIQLFEQTLKLHRTVYGHMTCSFHATTSCWCEYGALTCYALSSETAHSTPR